MDLGKTLERLEHGVKRSAKEIRAIATGNPARTIIVHPQVGKDDKEAEMMADQTPLPDGKWKGWEYREAKQAIDMMLEGRA
jgi:hypothetical protein